MILLCVEKAKVSLPDFPAVSVSHETFKDYAALGHGFPPQHPVDRLTYREGKHSSFEKSQPCPEL